VGDPNQNRAALAAVVVAMGLALVATPSAAAQEPAAPLLLTVEGGEGVDAPLIREALGDALGLPVVSLWDADADQAGRAINVAFEAKGRRARIRVQVARARPRWDQVEAADDAPQDGTWVVPEIERVLHEMQTARAARSTDRLHGCLDVLDPWRDTVPGPTLAPWDAERFAEATPIDEQQQRDARRQERADGLTRPRPPGH